MRPHTQRKRCTHRNHDAACRARPTKNARAKRQHASDGLRGRIPPNTSRAAIRLPRSSYAPLPGSPHRDDRLLKGAAALFARHSLKRPLVDQAQSISRASRDALRAAGNFGAKIAHRHTGVITRFLLPKQPRRTRRRCAAKQRTARSGTCGHRRMHRTERAREGAQQTSRAKVFDDLHAIAIVHDGARRADGRARRAFALMAGNGSGDGTGLYKRNAGSRAKRELAVAFAAGDNARIASDAPIRINHNEPVH